MTIASDGQACIWDVRYKELVKKNPRLFKDIKPNKDGSMPEIPWQPQFKLTLTKLEGVGDLGLGKLDLKCLHANVGEALCSQFFCSTEEGEMVFADFDPPASDDGGAKKSGAEGGAAGGKDDDEDRGAEYVQWMSQPHFRPSVALQRSPFFADVFVDVTDWSFTLWKDGLSTPIFYSPMSNSHFTSGRWSLQRPGVLFISKVDGDIDVWDFTDQSHRASLTLNVAPVAICSIEFSPMLYVISAIRARAQCWRPRISAACLILHVRSSKFPPNTPCPPALVRMHVAGAASASCSLPVTRPATCTSLTRRRTSCGRTRMRSSLWKRFWNENGHM
jgi:hypothetical protein